MAELILNDILRNVNLPNDVLNVSLADSLSGETAKSFASNVENTVHCGICAVTSSTVRMGW